MMGMCVRVSVPYLRYPEIRITLSRSHKGCAQKLSSYLDHKVQRAHILFTF